jgi:hypothetical protein
LSDYLKDLPPQPSLAYKGRGRKKDQPFPLPLQGKEGDKEKKQFPLPYEERRVGGRGQIWSVSKIGMLPKNLPGRERQLLKLSLKFRANKSQL